MSDAGAWVWCAERERKGEEAWKEKSPILPYRDKALSWAKCSPMLTGPCYLTASLKAFVFLGILGKLRLGLPRVHGQHPLEI